MLQALTTWQEAESHAHRLSLELSAAVAQLDRPKAERMARELQDARNYSAEMLRTTLELLASPEGK
ncbi:hypothetical protein [Roseateles chitinivorans]|uniref:hypothetical protein n=1 Tax=Roseateles chitinivorans TaxID=2917965 RepID=UPI00117DB14A|nr:hypothetical protein [Roseateles chitinivorans]